MGWGSVGSNMVTFFEDSMGKNEDFAERRKSSKRRGRPAKYPFAMMAVGDQCVLSFSDQPYIGAYYNAVMSLGYRKGWFFETWTHRNWFIARRVK